MDLRCDLAAIENTTTTISALVGKILDTLELIPCVIDQTENNNVPLEDVKRLEFAVKATLDVLTKLTKEDCKLTDCTVILPNVNIVPLYYFILALMANEGIGNYNFLMMESFLEAGESFDCISVTAL
ncbi:unnamed protein product [Strongylus vulgaris]|uniref:Uncharacterized protein n=1 Tax=Strongylus vulgaris TaxID=40348 RepID=A0A3P7KFV6_STRVU|nr:unnamed protein product [Strongylus vulgaris]